MSSINTKNFLSAMLLALFTLLSTYCAAQARTKKLLQTPGSRYRYTTYLWRSCRVERSLPCFQKVRTSTFSRHTQGATTYIYRSSYFTRSCSTWNTAKEIRVNSGSLSTRSNSYGRRSRYSYRERIISYREYQIRCGMRGSTIGPR